MHSLSIQLDISSDEQLVIEQFADINASETFCQNVVKQTVLSHIESDYLSSSCLVPLNITTEKPISISVYLVDEIVGKQLNNTYRHKNYATNVLSFESEISELPVEIQQSLPDFSLGELIICLPVVYSEAKQQAKHAHNHFTHLLVHGCLHLLGYDHELSDTVTQADADFMEKMEISILKKLNISNPYD